SEVSFRTYVLRGGMKRRSPRGDATGHTHGCHRVQRRPTADARCCSYLVMVVLHVV
ncbi:hypothetical protein A2U01_0076182, partial [Trifolium medium]|nr:hypothetical protein [Trifolium medium]